MDAAEVEEHHVPLNSGDSLQHQPENSLQQSASGTSTSDTSTIQSPSREIHEIKSTDMRVSGTGNTPATTNSPNIQTTTLNSSNNLNQKAIPGTSSTISGDRVEEFGTTKSDNKSENSDRR